MPSPSQDTQRRAQIESDASSHVVDSNWLDITSSQRDDQAEECLTSTDSNLLDQ